MTERTPPSVESAPRAQLPLYAKILTVLIALLLVLGVAARLFGPGLVRTQLLAACAQSLTRVPAIGQIAVNPLRLEVHINNFTVTDVDSSEAMGFDKLGVRLNPLPLLRGAITLSDVTLIRPRGRVVLLPDGSLNWARLVKLPDSTATPPPAKDPPEFNLKHFVIADGELYFEDRTRAPAYDQKLRPINLRLSNFSTKKDNQNRYSLEALSVEGEGFAWQGTFTMSPLRSNGSLKVTKLKATSVGELAAPYLPFALQAGTADVSALYALDGSATPARLELSELGSTLTGITIADKATARPLIQVTSLRSSGGTADVLTRTLSLGTVESPGGSLLMLMQPDGHTNFEAWAEPPPGPAGTTKAVAGTTKAPVDTTQVWTSRIPALTFTNWALTFEDQRLTPPAVITVPACSIGVRDFSTAAGTSFPLATSVAFDGGGRGRVTGKVTPGGPSADLDVDVNGFDLRQIDPYVAMSARVQIKKGTVGARGRLSTRPPGTREPDLRFVGTVQSQDFSSVDHRLQTELISWKRLEVKGLDYAMLPPHVLVREVKLTRPFLRAVIGADRTTNLQSVAVPPESLPPAFRPPPGKPDSVPTRVDAVLFNDGAMFFADLTLKPNFVTGIQSLNGYLKGLSSASASHAELELDGKVDAYAPVRIYGTLNPLTAEQRSDITFDFKNIELTTFTPYSGKFMGYPIERGKLSLALNYKIDGRQLKGENKVRIEKLTLGEKTDSPDATRLPIRFAIALLKDKNGDIDLDVPVSGNLDDPEFNIWRIIGKMVLNLVTRLVTSPFKLMGAMFGGGEDENLEILNFSPGSSVLVASETHKLTTLGKGLTERPALRLDITETAHPVVDSVALAEHRFEVVILDQRALVTKQAALPDSAGIDDLPHDLYVRCLEAAYRAKFGVLPKRDATRAKGLKGAAKDSAMAVIEAHRVQEMEFRVREALPTLPGDVALLARTRAENIRRWLLEHQAIEPSRIFIVRSADAVVGDSIAVQVKLALNGE